MPKLHQPGFLGQLQYLHEQSGQLFQVPLTELADGAEVRRIQRRDHHEIGPLDARLGDPPGRIDAAGIAVQQQRHHQLRIERRLAKRAPVAAHDLAEAQAFPHQPQDET
jgi:hypothetical protein